MNKGLMVLSQEIICLKNKGWAYLINLDEYADVGTHWIALVLNMFLKKLKNLLEIKT